VGEREGEEGKDKMGTGGWRERRRNEERVSEEQRGGLVVVPVDSPIRGGPDFQNLFLSLPQTTRFYQTENNDPHYFGDDG
jgi:hypothetical protein